MQLKPFFDSISQNAAQLTYGESPVELYEPIRYIMSLGGKRLRPIFTLLTANLFTDDWQKAIKPALAVEVFHNFTLMHDDIMDKAPLRRGMATVHEKWNANIAILSGDVMLVNAYELLLDIDKNILPDVLRRFNRTAAEVCEGQQLDMNFETLENISKGEYIEMIRLKTSVLLGFAMELGAILVGADSIITKQLYDAGVCYGLGFQLTDDLLDVYGDPVKFGKQVGGDIISNKKTYLLLDALEKAKDENKLKLLNWISKSEFDKAEKVKQVTQIFTDLEVDKTTKKLIKQYFDAGFEILNDLDLDSERKKLLIDFIESLAQRES